MTERNTEIPWYKSQMTPKDVARYFRDYAVYGGYNVGKKYQTYGELWSEDEMVVQTGLLHLILDKMEDMQRQKFEEQRKKNWHVSHKTWLRVHVSSMRRLLAQHEKEAKRLIEMFGSEIKRSSDLIEERELRHFSQLFRNSREEYRGAEAALRCKVARMQSVKKRDDLLNLKGIGKKTLQKLQSRATQAARCN